jgi:methyltransferase-like protein
MPEPPATAYDDMPYPGRPFAQTHPDRLAALASLLGMAPAAPSHCRVLELGCGDGGNLIPMALVLPGSTFVGVDLSAGTVARGQAIITELGLTNITLGTLDVCEVSREFGEFDYVLAHGLYSWVPPAVRDKILAVCADNLAPQGVAYVSYNVYPGCRRREMVGEMLRYHIRNVRDPRQRVAEAKAFARYLADAQPSSGPDLSSLRQEFEEVARRDDHLLYHDDLAEINAPVYFHEFMEHAGRHGLQFLAEADFFETQDDAFPPRVTGPLRRLAGDDILVHEQYFDFLKCRRFRQTLLCHAGVRLDRRPRPDVVFRMWAASPARPARGAVDLAPAVAEQFQGPTGSSLTTDYPPVKAIFVALGEVWPSSLPFADLAARARALLGPAAGPESEAPFLARIVCKLYAAGMVELYAEGPHFTLEPGARPAASPLARLQLRNQAPAVADLRHSCVPLPDPMYRRLVQLLDGCRDRAALLDDLCAFAVAAGVLRRPDGQPVTEPGQARAIIAPALEPSLRNVGRLALLLR